MGRKPYPDAPCVVCGKVGHMHSLGMCRPCYEHYKRTGDRTPPARHTVPISNGVSRNGWTRIAHDNGTYTYKCDVCGTEKTLRSRQWPNVHYHKPETEPPIKRVKKPKITKQAAPEPHGKRDEDALTDPAKREALKRRIWAVQDKLSCKTIMRREDITRDELDELYDEAIRDYKDEATKHTMVGLHFAAWEVLEIGDVYIGASGHEAHYYLCRCKCGKTKTIKGGDLIKRTIRDCGCGAAAAIPPAKPRKPKDPRWENYMGGVTAHV